MRVLHVIDSLDSSGGAEQALAVQARALIDAGIDLHVAYLSPRHGLHPILETAGAQVTYLGAPEWYQAIRPLRQLIHRVQPELVHTTLFQADLSGRIAGRLTGVPVVSSLVTVAYGAQHFAWRGIRRSRLRAAQAFDAGTARWVRRFAAITEHVADVMSRRLLIPRELIDVVPRGRDPQVLGDWGGNRRLNVRRELGLRNDTPLIVAAARHEYPKGLDILVEALPAVRAAVPGTVLAVAGRDGSCTTELRGLAAKMDDDAVRLLGRRADVLDVLAAAVCFVAPSRWEGLGSALLEAMGVGAPAVVTDIPAFREVLGQGNDCGRMVPVEDVSALARAICATLTDREEATRRATAARVRFNENYTLRRAIDKTIAFYGTAVH